MQYNIWVNVIPVALVYDRERGVKISTFFFMWQELARSATRRSRNRRIGSLLLHSCIREALLCHCQRTDVTTVAPPSHGSQPSGSGGWWPCKGDKRA